MMGKFIIGGLLCCFTFCFATIAGLEGKWTGSIKLPDGNVYLVTYIFRIKGDELTGTAQAEGAPKNITGGKINNNDFSFSIIDDDGKAMPHTGKYFPQGDSVTIAVEYGGSVLHGILKRSDK